MPADLSKSLVHSAEHFRTILFPVTPVTTVGAAAHVLTMPTIPPGSILLGAGPASSYDNIETTTPGTNRTYTPAFGWGTSIATGGTVSLTTVGVIAAANVKEINLAVTIFTTTGV